MLTPQGAVSLSGQLAQQMAAATGPRPGAAGRSGARSFASNPTTLHSTRCRAGVFERPARTVTHSTHEHSRTSTIVYSAPIENQAPKAAPRGGGSHCGTDGDDGDGQGSRFWAGAQRPPHRPLETAPAGRKILAVLGRRNTDFTEKETVNCNLQLSIFLARRPLHGHARPLLTPP